VSESNLNDLLGAAAFLYQKQEGGKYVNKVMACLIPYEENDDEFAMKAKAERYFNEDCKDQIDGFNLVAWSFAAQSTESA